METEADQLQQDKTVTAMKDVGQGELRQRFLVTSGRSDTCQSLRFHSWPHSAQIANRAPRVLEDCRAER